jgi:diamine N-acetyltransferase
MEKQGLAFENDNIFLRKPEPEDIDFLCALENDPTIWWVSDTRTPFSRWQIKLHIENSVYDIFTNKELRLIIIQKESNRPVGIVDLFDFDPLHDRAGVGIIILPEYRNMSFASQCLDIIKSYCFNWLNLNQIWCNIDADNSVSIKLFESAGFRKSGELKKWKKSEDIYKDVNFYQLIKE